MDPMLEQSKATAGLYIFSAPSGGGKTSLARALARDCADVSVSVSHTTRNRRSGEKDGKDYFFVDCATFELMIEQGDFLEHARVFDHYYGTSRSPVDKALAAGQKVILDIDWQGARKVRQAAPGSVTVFFLPPSVEVLAERLSSRGRDSADEIHYRMERAISEMGHFEEYDHVLVNDRFEDTVAQLKELVLEGRLPTSINRQDAATLVKSAENVRLKS